MTPGTARRGLPIREVLRGRRLNAYDLLLAVGIAALGYLIIKLGQAMTVNFTPGRTEVKLNTDIVNVPYYAARSLLRMFIALTLSIKVFPSNLLGLELASIFVIVTSQAWNMTFSFYHSLISQPTELDEAARMYRLTKWQRFWKLDVPSSMIGLVWNMMMSMGGGWFFLTASEAITVFIGGKQ